MSRLEILIIFSIQIVYLFNCAYARFRIVNGQHVRIERYPYLVSIAAEGEHFCGGSYIKSVWVLTVAHCIYNQTILNKTTCRMGITLLSVEEGVQVRKAKAFILHPRYDDDRIINDVGLIKINSAFRKNKRVATIKMATKAYTYYSKKCRVAGWGVTDEYNLDLPDQLSHVYLPLWTEEQCCKIYRSKLLLKQFKDHKIICAGYKDGGADACQGDSGGPFVCSNKQVGLVSWGLGCGSKLPGIYSNISTFFPWINGIINRRKFSASVPSSSVIYPSKFSIIILGILTKQTCYS